MPPHHEVCLVPGTVSTAYWKCRVLMIPPATSKFNSTHAGVDADDVPLPLLVQLPSEGGVPGGGPGCVVAGRVHVNVAASNTSRNIPVPNAAPLLLDSQIASRVVVTGRLIPLACTANGIVVVPDPRVTACGEQVPFADADANRGWTQTKAVSLDAREYLTVAAPLSLPPVANAARVDPDGGVSPAMVTLSVVGLVAGNGRSSKSNEFVPSM